MVPLKYGLQCDWRTGPSEIHVHGRTYRQPVFPIFTLLLRALEAEKTAILIFEILSETCHHVGLPWQ